MFVQCTYIIFLIINHIQYIHVKYNIIFILYYVITKKYVYIVIYSAYLGFDSGGFPLKLYISINQCIYKA